MLHLLVRNCGISDIEEVTGVHRHNLLRTRHLHHRLYNMKMQQIEKRIQRELRKKKLLSSEHIINILQHIEEQVNVAVL